MASASLAAVLRQVCGWAARYTDHNLPDHQLLERFAVGRDEAAFAALLRRHGGMVLGVARRFLHDAHAAEDVFQNTFLTLARRAGSIRKRESIASWLYGVAARLSSQTRMRDARRPAREREASSPPATENVTEAAAWRELGAVLDEELLRLPERYRAPLVLIYFVGQTQEEAARQLGWSKGTLRRRVERGKRLLHERLLRRGVSLSIGLLVGGVAQSAAEASLPLSLIRRTVEEAVRVASGEAALWVAGAASLTRAKIVLALGLLIAGGAGVAALHRGGEQPKVKQEENSKPPAHEAKRPRVDRFGDPLPEGAIGRLGTMRLRHGYGTSLAFASDDKTLLSCGADRVIRSWDTASGRLLCEQRLPPAPMASFTSPTAVLSPDARFLAFEDRLGTLFLWDVAGNRLRHKIAVKGSWPRVLFSPDSKTLVTAENDGTLRVWDVNTGAGRLLGQHKKQIYSLAFSADDKLMSMDGEQTVRFWYLPFRRPLLPITVPKHVVGATVSPDRQVVATWSDWDLKQDKGLQFWDAVSGDPVKDWTPPQVKGIRTARFSPDGKTILIGMEDSVLVWDPLAGKRVRMLPGASGFDLTFSHDGKSVALLGGASGPNAFVMESMVRLWDLATGTPHAANRPEHGHVGSVLGVAFSPDGRTLASSCPSDGTVRLWDVASGRLLRSLPVREGASLIFTPDGKYLLGSSRDAILRWEVATGRRVGSYLFVQEDKEGLDYLTCMHLTEDGRTLLALSTNSSNRGLHAWDVTTGKRTPPPPLSERDTWFWTVYLARYASGRPLSLPPGSIRDPAVGRELRRLFDTEKGLGMPIVFSPDGSLLAMGVQQEVRREGMQGVATTAVQVWERATLLPVARLTTGEVSLLDFTADGRHLIAAGADSLSLWDLVSRQRIARRSAPGLSSSASAFAVAPNDRTVAKGNADTTILLWDLSPPAAKRPAAPRTDAQREASWTDLAGDDAGRALTAIAHLTDEPKQTVPMLRDRLHAAKAPSAEELRQLLADLDNAEFARREKATKRLAELGELAQTALREALQRKPSLEVRRRIDNLLAASRRVHTPEERRHLRAIRVLESIGTAEARQVLETLGEGDPDARRTKAAKDALRRLTHRSRPSSD